MSLKKEIIALLKTKFPGVQLSEARINQIASKVDAKVTTEEEIDAKLTELDEILSFADIAKQDDRLRSLEAEAKKAKPADPASVPDPANPEKKDPPAPGTDPALLAILNEVKNGLAELKGAKVLNDRKSLLEAKLKDAPESYRIAELRKFARMKFDTDEEFNDYLTETETDAAAMIQSDAASEVGTDIPRVGAGGNNGKVKPASKAELDDVMQGIKI